MDTVWIFFVSWSEKTLEKVDEAVKKWRQTRLILVFKFGKSPTFQPVHRVSFAVNRGIYEHEKLKKKKST